MRVRVCSRQTDGGDQNKFRDVVMFGIRSALDRQADGRREDQNQFRGVVMFGIRLRVDGLE